MEIKDIISSGLLELYAAGLASAEETLQVQQWVELYPDVADELRKIEESIDLYMQANATPPAAGVKEKIFQRINEAEPAKVISITAPIEADATEGKLVPATSFWRNIAAAVALLLVSSVVYNIVLVNKNKQTAALLENTRQSLATLEDKNSGLSRDMQVIQSKYSLPVALNGLDAAPDAAAKIFWMKNTGEVFIDPSNLPPAPQGKRYQLWAFVDGKPVDAGLILTAKTGDKYRIQKMKTFGRVEAFAVSLEEIKDKPSVTPLGPVLVMGKI